MKPQKKVKVRNSKIREFEKIAASNRSAAKRLALLRQKMVLGFAASSVREGVHSSQIIPANNVVQLRARKKVATRRAAKGDPAHTQRPKGEGFRYQMGFMVPRFQSSSRYMDQVASAKRKHLSEVEQLIEDSKAIKRTDNEMTKMLTLGDMKAVAKIKKKRGAQVKKIQRQHMKAKKAKAALEAAASGVAGMGALDDDYKPWYSTLLTGAGNYIKDNIGDIVTGGVVGVIGAKTQAEVNKANSDAQMELLKRQQDFVREQAAFAAANPPATAVQNLQTVAQNALEKPWYQNPMVLLPAAGVLGWILWKK